MNPIPIYPTPGGSVAIGDTIIVLGGPYAHSLDTTTGTWATLDSMPTIRSFVSAAVTSDSNILIACGFLGGTSFSDKLEALNFDTGIWTTKQTAPFVRGDIGVTSDGRYMWAAGTRVNPAVDRDFFEYDSHNDVWSSKEPSPVAVKAPSVTYTPGRVIVIGNLMTQVYIVVTDAWTTKSPAPTTIALYFSNAAVVGSFAFVLADATTLSNLERYSLLDDVWTTLGVSPTRQFRSASAVTSSGLIVAVGANPGTDVHAYDLTTAFLQGDPEIRTVDGLSGKVELFPGVFNLIYTASLVVNVLMDTLDTLPPQENMVVVAACARLKHKGTILIFCCSANDLRCENVYKHATPRAKEELAMQDVVFKTGPDTIVIKADNITLTLTHSSVNIVEYNHDASQAIATYSTSRFLNIAVSTSPSLSPLIAGGLLGKQRVSTFLASDYYIESGDLTAIPRSN